MAGHSSFGYLFALCELRLIFLGWPAVLLESVCTEKRLHHFSYPWISLFLTGCSADLWSQLPLPMCCIRLLRVRFRCCWPLYIQNTKKWVTLALTHFPAPHDVCVLWSSSAVAQLSHLSAVYEYLMCMSVANEGFCMWKCVMDIIILHIYFCSVDVPYFFCQDECLSPTLSWKVTHRLSYYC